ncbi:amino acid synthesis family protein [Agromyces neolithicus]|uniref:Amino acid synthesis family protein n=1 Tax=Agromyces neolithicus TaxID=269420 RepID=A0ABN2M1Z9_9MICO
MSAVIDATARTYDLSTVSTLNDYSDVAAAIGLRTILVSVEEMPASGLRTQPILRAAATAVIRNPWVGTATDADLQPETERIAPVLAKLLTDRLIDALGGAASIEAFGKAAVVGLSGEIEHAGALIHTPYFGNLMREALQGTSILCFVDDRSGPGRHLRVPLWHKTEPTTRDYYQSLDVILPDAPHHDEIAVIAAASTGPRPHARIGDRMTDRPVTSEILKGIAL